MNTTTITTNSITQFRRYAQILKSKRVLHLITNTDSYPYTITFTNRSTKQANNIQRRLPLAIVGFLWINLSILFRLFPAKKEVVEFSFQFNHLISLFETASIVP